MSAEFYVSKKPSLTSLNYKTKYDTPFVVEKKKKTGFEWYRGTGVEPRLHPLKDQINFIDCRNCNSKNVHVIAAQWNVNLTNGDQYYDYELGCLDCEKFTRVTFADND